jgi:hypothetical protein
MDAATVGPIEEVVETDVSVRPAGTPRLAVSANYSFYAKGWKRSRIAVICSIELHQEAPGFRRLGHRPSPGRRREGVVPPGEPPGPSPQGCLKPPALECLQSSCVMTMGAH